MTAVVVCLFILVEGRRLRLSNLWLYRREAALGSYVGERSSPLMEPLVCRDTLAAA